ncbi:hypothetical protein QJS10_CPB04g00410 [Acorus calamus]|uniref:Disease resistance N-terminal domain-containing protein n=1 Tax=Acorus calamus TaxID=4465 RepID=A0AAV9F1F0_ACOCL|nr:hypothetical protein QJS10_CPB04g00408 [Acorus calamus]KAK1319444.1 hypothetical protein QJS10_CPB04g00410 [Acorus calamus]
MDEDTAFIELDLGKLSLKEIGKQLRVGGELNKLRDTLKSIKAVIASAMDRQDEDVAVQQWLREVKDVARDAKDLLEEFDAKKRMRFNLMRRRQVLHRIEKINKRLKDIKATWGTFGFTQGSM